MKRVSQFLRNIVKKSKGTYKMKQFKNQMLLILNSTNLQKKYFFNYKDAIVKSTRKQLEIYLVKRYFTCKASC